MQRLTINVRPHCPLYVVSAYINKNGASQLVNAKKAPTFTPETASVITPNDNISQKVDGVKVENTTLPSAENEKNSSTDEAAPLPLAERGNAEKLTIPEGSKIVNNIVVDKYSQRIKAQNPRAYSNIIRMAKRLGMNVRFVKNLTDENGKVLEGLITSKGIFINADAKNPSRFVATHEFGHRMKQAAPKVWAKYQEYVISKLKRESFGNGMTAYDVLYEETRNAYGKDDPDSINEEIAVNYAGELFDSEEMLESFIREDKSLALCVRDWWYKVLESMGLLNEKKKAQQMWLRAYTAAGKNVKDGKVGEFSGEKFKYVGETDDGRKIYRTNYKEGTPKSVKQNDLIDIIQNVWSKKPIHLTIKENGVYKEISANFNPELSERSDLSKIVFGNRKGNGSEKRMTLDLSTDLYQIASDAKQTGSKTETGKDNKAHDGVKHWYYFITNLVYEDVNGKHIDCYMNIDVKENQSGHYFYSFAIEKGTAPQTLLAVVSDEMSPTVPIDNSISNDNPTVKNNYMQNDGNNSQNSSSKESMGNSGTRYKYTRTGEDISLKNAGESDKMEASYGGADYDYSRTTRKVYNDRAWAYTLLNNEDLALLKEKYQEYFIDKIGRENGYIEVNNKLIFLSGSYNNPKITEVVVINAEDSMTFDIYKDLYEGGILYAYTEADRWSKQTIEQSQETNDEIELVKIYDAEIYAYSNEKSFRARENATLPDEFKSFGYTGSFTIRDGIYRKNEEGISGSSEIKNLDHSRISSTKAKNVAEGYSGNVNHSLKDKGKKSEQYGVMWTLDKGVLDNSEVSAFYDKISETNNNKYPNYHKSADGQFIYEIGNKLIYTDGDYDYPHISKVIVFNINDSYWLEYGRESFYDGEEYGYQTETIIEIVEAVLGEGAVKTATYDSYETDKRSGKPSNKRKNGTKTNRGSQKDVSSKNYSLKDIEGNTLNNTQQGFFKSLNDTDEDSAKSNSILTDDSDDVLDKKDVIGYVPINRVKMKTFPPYNESESDANEWSTRWAHREDVESGAQTLVFYHNRCYVIEKYDSADLKYQIEGRISYNAYKAIRKELEEDARNREKQRQKKMVDFIRERNEPRNTDEGRGQSLDYSSVKFGREDRDILQLDRKQDGEREVQSDFSRSDEYDSEDRKTKGLGESKSYLLKENETAYTYEEYQAFGWARANDILNEGQNADYRSKFAMAKSGQAKFPKSKSGEYIIPVSDIYDSTFEGINNVLVFAKGAISNPIITSVIEIYEYDETSLDRVRRRIYDGERRGIQQKTGELFGRYFASDFEFRPNQQRIGFESVRNSSDNGYGEGSSGETSSNEERADVNLSLKGTVVEGELASLVKKYGVIPKGEKPYRDVTVPKKTAKDKKVSQTVRTILEAKATPDEAVPTIEKMVEDGIFSYDVYTDKEAINDTEDYIKEYGWKKSREKT